MKFSSESLFSLNSRFLLSPGTACPNWCPQRETLDANSLMSESMFSIAYANAVGNLVPERLDDDRLGNPVPEILDIDFVGKLVSELLDVDIVGDSVPERISVWRYSLET